MINGRTKEYWEYDWQEVEECRNNKKLQKKHRLKPTDYEMLSIQPCPNCNKPGKELTLIYFESPDWTWQHLCGRSGHLVLCDACHLQTEFFGESMS